VSPCQTTPEETEARVVDDSPNVDSAPAVVPVTVAAEDLAAAPAAPNVARVAENCDLGGRSRSIRARHCHHTVLVDLTCNPNLGRNSADETPGWD
jgi:hypothetical protein